MKNFEELLKAELEKLSYEKHYGDDQLTKFELGARWLLSQLHLLVGDIDFPVYVKRGDYCAVCGSQEFFNDEWMEKEDED